MSLEMRSDETEGEFNVLDYWLVLLKHKGLIVGLTSIVAITTALYCHLFATKLYEARATILSPKESSSGGVGVVATALAASAGGQFLGNLLSGGGSNRDTFVLILKSRTVAEELAERFKLKDHYGAALREHAIAALQGATEITVSKEGLIAVRVEDRDRAMAADLANAYVTQLDRFFSKMGVTEVGRQRAFLVDRLEKTEKALRQAEEGLRSFQERHRAVVLSDQSRGAIEASAKIRAEIAAAEVQLESARIYATETNPNIIQQKTRIQELKRQLVEMQYGKGLNLPHESPLSSESRQEMHVPFVKVPELGMELARLMREVKIQEGVFTLLTQQYEQAKILEAKDTPTVQVLDPAVPALADAPAKPRTWKNSIGAGVAGMLFAVFLAFFLEYIERIRKSRKGLAVSSI